MNTDRRIDSGEPSAWAEEESVKRRINYVLDRRLEISPTWTMIRNKR